MTETTSRPLSILQVASGFPGWGGTELHLLNLSAQLVRRGHDVTVACRPDGWVRKRAEEMGLPIFEVTVRRQLDWSGYGKYTDFCRANHVDVVHAHWSTDAIVPATAAKFAGVPVRVLTRHSPYPLKVTTKFILSRVLYNRIVAISGSVARKIKEHGIIPDSKVTVIHHGTDVPQFEAVTQSAEAIRAELGIPGDAVVAGIVGRVAQEKGHTDLFNAMKLLGKDNSLRLLVVGDGPDSDAARAYVADNGLADRVVFSPFRTDVNNVFNALDIVVVPSTWEEPCSAVIQQAMALRKPVIGTSTGGTPEMIVDGGTGLLAAPNDPAGLAAALDRLAEDPALRKSMGEAGHERVVEHFSLQVMTDRVEELYRREYELVRGSGTLQRALAS